MKLFSIIKSIVERFPRITRIYRAVRDQLDNMEEPQLTPWGFKLAGNLAMTRGTFEPVETKLVRKLLLDVDVFVNVGANVGYYCCHALSMGKSVIAFEPIERNLQFLFKNIKANGWDGIEVFPLALSNKAGIIEIYGGNTGASLIKDWANIPENYMTIVPSSTIDLVLNHRLEGKRVLFVVDIEGAEKLMLDGARHALTNNPKPIWMVEIMTKDHQPKDAIINPNLVSTFQLFFENGYEAFSVDVNMQKITIEKVESVANGLSSFQTHNFIFS